MEWTLFLGMEVRTWIWGLGVGRKGTLYILRLNQGHCLMPASPSPLALSQLLAQMPALLAPLAFVERRGMKMLGMVLSSASKSLA